MLTAIAAPVAPPAARLLTPPPARYGLVVDGIAHYYKRFQVHNLWMNLFNCNTFGSDQDEFNLIDDLLDEVANLFDLNLDYSRELLYSAGENPLDYPVYFSGYRIPWEAASLFEIADYQRPLAAAIADTRVQDVGEIDLYYDEVLWDRDTFVLPASQAELRQVIDRLAAQPAPFNALADMLETSLELRTDSVFFLASDVAWEEYAPRDIFWWTVEDIRTLTEHYNRAKPAIERIKAYADWFYAAEATGSPDFCPHRATLRILQEVAHA